MFNGVEGTSYYQTSGNYPNQNVKTRSLLKEVVTVVGLTVFTWAFADIFIRHPRSLNKVIVNGAPFVATALVAIRRFHDGGQQVRQTNNSSDASNHSGKARARPILEDIITVIAVTIFSWSVASIFERESLFLYRLIGRGIPVLTIALVIIRRLYASDQDKPTNNSSNISSNSRQSQPPSYMPPYNPEVYPSAPTSVSSLTTNFIVAPDPAPVTNVFIQPSSQQPTYPSVSYASYTPQQYSSSTSFGVSASTTQPMYSLADNRDSRGTGSGWKSQKNQTQRLPDSRTPASGWSGNSSWSSPSYNSSEWESQKTSSSSLPTSRVSSSSGSSYSNSTSTTLPTTRERNN